MQNRKAIPQDVIAAVLVLSARRCCLCFGLNGDFTQKQGQIAHADHDSTNPAFDNLIFLCLAHHDQYDGRTGQSKGITVEEVKAYRSMLYQKVEQWHKGSDFENTPEIRVITNYDAGHRIQAVREELGIKVSQFVEMLNYPSQREFESIESGDLESSVLLLERISNFTNVSFEWLKHGNEPRFEVGYLPFYPLEKITQIIKELEPKQIYLTLETKELHIGLIFQLDDYRFRTFDLGMCLDFWNWVDHFSAINYFYDFLSWLCDRISLPFGCMIPNSYDKQLYRGSIHPITAIKQSKQLSASWPEELLDYQHKNKSASYCRSHYGRWILGVQEEFEKRLDKFTDMNDK
jgi:transcriptional regulator with XRE-family HTH domain